jgi:hypothetical protein
MSVCLIGPTMFTWPRSSPRARASLDHLVGASEKRRGAHAQNVAVQDAENQTSALDAILAI